MTAFDPTATEIPIDEFDTLARNKEFVVGPFIDTFVDKFPGAPYTPNRDVWGTLKDGRRVRAVKSWK